MQESDKDAEAEEKCDKQCRFCGINTEYIPYMISSCPKTSLQYYLQMRHTVLARTIYNEIRRKDNFQVI